MANLTNVSANVSESVSFGAHGEAHGTLGGALAMTGGSLYAIGALMVSYSSRAKSLGVKGWTDRTVQCWSFLSWMAMNTGGLCVTFAYQSGASVPLMNAIVYSTNLLLNMVFQMFFKLSKYTKPMRCGTLLFAMAALLLGDLSPAPHKVSLSLLSQPQAIAWNLAFVCLWTGSAVMIRRARSLPATSSLKIMAWALHIASWGSFTDNWAKINGTFDTSSTMYWILFLPYMPVGMLVMVLSVSAMVATDVALYVPANLCLQLILNVISGLLLWGEAERIPQMLPYVVGYMICILAVYIATPEMDLVASLKQSRELRSRGLSRQVAQTSFGKSLLLLLEKWGQMALAQDSASPAPDTTTLQEETKQAIEKTLLSGLDGMAFSKEQIVDLVLRLWRRDGQYRPCAETMAWLQGTPYFREYLAKDPAFGEVLAGALSKHENMAMQEAVSPAETSV